MIDIFTYRVFTIAGSGVTLLELLSVIFGLTVVFMAGRQNKNNFWFGYIYTILLFFLMMEKRLYASMLLQPISLAINIYGHYRWTHPKKGEENTKMELKVSRLSTFQIWLTLVAISLFTLLWGYALESFTQPTRPYLDAFVVAMILLAQYLSASKKIECWGAWLVVNVTNITLYILAGMVFMPIVSGIYLINAIVAIRNWRKTI